MGENFNEQPVETATETKEVAVIVKDPLVELRDITRIKLYLQFVSTLCLFGMLVAVIISCVILVPKAEQAIMEVTEAANFADKSFKELDEMSASLELASDNLNTLVVENGEPLSNAVKSMEEVDYEGLNKAIKDLQDAVEPLANFFNRFK
jgi:hypothetical protein